MRTLLQIVARWSVLIAVVLSPWLFGSAEPWAYLGVCLLVQIGTAAWLVDVYRGAHTARFTLVVAALGLALLAAGAVQILPLPGAIVKAVNPISAEIQATGEQILNQFPSSLMPPPSDGAESPLCTLSVSASETRRSLYLLFAYLSVFLVLTGTASDREEIHRAAAIVVGSSFVLALLAIIQDFSGTGLIYWFHQPRLGGMVFGPFTNRNHYAAYMNMSFGLALALMLSNRAANQHATPWRDRVSEFSSRNANWVVMLAYITIVMGSSVCLSLSRGGITSLAFAVGLMAAIMTRHYRHVTGKGPLIAMGLLIAAMVFWLGWEPVIKRLSSITAIATDPLMDTRFLVTMTTLQQWGSSPIFGSGPGTFQYVFPLFQRPLLQFGRFVYAHNDYAQFLAEWGLAGAAAAAALVFFLVRTARRRYREVSESSRLFVIGLCISFAAIALHSLLDFSLHRPANAFLLAFICGLCFSVLRLPGQGRDYLYEEGREGLGIKIAALAGLALVATVGLLELRELGGELAFARFVQWQQIADKSTTQNTRAISIEEASLEADAVLGSIARNPDAYLEIMVSSLSHAADERLPAELRIHLAKQAELAGVLAVRTVPSDYEYWLWLGRTKLVVGDRVRGRIALDRARDLAPPGMKLESVSESLY